MNIRFNFLVSCLLASLCGPMAFAEMASRQEHPMFTTALNFIPKELDSRRVTGVPHYTIMQHIMLPLLQFERDGGVAGALLDSWNISPDFKTFTLNLGDHKFSDGSPIEAEDVQATLEANRDAGESVHFDFRLIKTISSPSKKQVVVVLNEPNQYFLEQTVQPEFGVVPRGEAKKPLYKRSLLVTSGPYYIESSSADELILVRNNFFKEWVDTSPEKVQVISAMAPEVNKLAKAGAIGFIQETRFSVEPFNDLLKQGYSTYKPKSAQSIFLTIHPESSALRTLENRKFVQKIVRSADIQIAQYGELFERAQQLFYKSGASTLNAEEESAVWSSVDAMKKPEKFPKVLTLSSSKGSPLNEPLVNKFSKYGIRLVIRSPEMTERVEKWADSDMAVMNMDFAGNDLLENLHVVFSSAEPIIRVPKSFGLDAMMTEARETPRGHGRQAIIKKVGHKLLETGYATPIVYQNMIFAIPGNRTTSRWSQLFYDAALWRLPLKDAKKPQK